MKEKWSQRRRRRRRRVVSSSGGDRACGCSGCSVINTGVTARGRSLKHTGVYIHTHTPKHTHTLPKAFPASLSDTIWHQPFMRKQNTPQDSSEWLR